jgi:hypothetical protein
MAISPMRIATHARGLSAHSRIDGQPRGPRNDVHPHRAPRAIRIDGDRDSCIASGELKPESHVDSHPWIVISQLLRIAMHFGASYIRDADMTVRSRITSHTASSISQFTAFALHDCSRRQRRWCRSPASRGRMSHHQVSGREYGFGQARWTAQCAPRSGWFSRLRERDVSPAVIGSAPVTPAGGCMRSHKVSMLRGIHSSTYALSRATFTRFGCTRPEKAVHLRLSSVRRYAGSDGTAPAAPPGDRPGVSLHQWS